jgi:hypothetical protein
VIPVCQARVPNCQTVSLWARILKVSIGYIPLPAHYSIASPARHRPQEQDGLSRCTNYPTIRRTALSAAFSISSVAEGRSPLGARIDDSRSSSTQSATPVWSRIVRSNCSYPSECFLWGSFRRSFPEFGTEKLFEGLRPSFSAHVRLGRTWGTRPGEEACGWTAKSSHPSKSIPLNPLGK